MTDYESRRETRTRTSDRQSTAERTPTEKGDPITHTMGDVSHKHPYTDRGAINRPFKRGPVVAADGGRRNARKKRRMKDVDHTPPHGEGAERVFHRGGEGEEDEA